MTLVCMIWGSWIVPDASSKSHGSKRFNANHDFFSQHISKFYRSRLHCQVLLMTTEECSFLSMCGIRRETFFTLPSNLVTLNARVHALPLEVTRGSRARLSCSVPIKLLPHRKTSHSFKVLISFSYKNYFNQSNATGVFPINIFFHLQLTTYMQTC